MAVWARQMTGSSAALNSRSDFCRSDREFFPCSRAGGGQRPEGGAGHMNKYELAVVVSAKLEDDARAEVVEKVKALITRFGGNVTDVDEWGKRRFAYEIQKMKEGFYYFVHFESDAAVPGEVEQRIRIMDNVLRYLCVKQEA